jgi:hypothetical protein
MDGKPEGPIWVDFAPWLFNAPTNAQLVALANLALNRLTLRGIAEVCADAGVSPPDLDFVPATPAQPREEPRDE